MLKKSKFLTLNFFLNHYYILKNTIDIMIITKSYKLLKVNFNNKKKSFNKNFLNYPT